MSHLLTVKIPESLLAHLQQKALGRAKSKGALVREALEEFLLKSSSQTSQIEEITNHLKK